jgi:hypothetical protein
MPLSLDSGVDIPDHVVFRSFVSETVLLNLETGKYHGLNSTAGHMLEVAAKAGSLADAAAELAEEYGVDREVVAKDLVDLCDGLLERGLLVAGEVCAHE